MPSVTTVLNDNTFMCKMSFSEDLRNIHVHVMIRYDMT